MSNKKTLTFNTVTGKLKIEETKHIDPAKHKPRKLYYKTECLACDVIIGIHWEQICRITISTPFRKKAMTCPLCEGQRTKNLKIKPDEYHHIERSWDLIALSDEKEDLETEDWLSWFK